MKKTKRQLVRHILITEISYEFLHFLIINRILTLFMNNAVDYICNNNENKLEDIEDIKHLINNLLDIRKNNRNYIAMFFSWRMTKQGYSFWLKFSFKYEEYLIKRKVKRK